MSSSQSVRSESEKVPTVRPYMPVDLFKAAINGGLILPTVPEEQQQTKAAIKGNMVLLAVPEEQTANEVNESHACIIDIDRLSPKCFDNVRQLSLPNQWERTEVIGLPNQWERTAVIGLSSALIITITFAAAFTIPEGYKQDEGTPVLARNYMFRAFIMANTLAFLFGFLSLYKLFKRAVEGQPGLAFLSAIDYFMLAANNMIVAFGLRLYVMLASDCLPIAISVLVITFITSITNMNSTSNNWKKVLAAYAGTFLLIFGLAKL